MQITHICSGEERLFINLHDITNKSESSLFLNHERQVDKQLSELNHRTKTNLQRQNFPVDGVEVGHGNHPRTQTGNVSANLLGGLQVEVFHGKIRHQKFGSFTVDGVFGKVEQVR